MHQLIVFDNSSFKRKMIFAASNGNLINKSKTFEKWFFKRLKCSF
jgi:hypothetical protein